MRKVFGTKFDSFFPAVAKFRHCIKDFLYF